MGQVKVRVPPRQPAGSASRWPGRRAVTTPEDPAGQHLLFWLLALHGPIVAVTWLWTGRGAGWALAGLAVVALGVTLAVFGSSTRTRTPAVRLALVAAAMCTVAVHGVSSAVAPVPYVAVMLLVACYAPIRLRRRNAGVADSEAEVLARLDELSRTKDQLMAMVSHEFRTPLTGVMGYARTMSTHLDELDEDTLRLFVESIEGQSRRLAYLVDNLVATSRKVEPSPDAVCDLHAVTAAVMAELGPPGDPRHRVQISLRGRLRAAIGTESAHRVLLNLIDNAVKFADPDTLVRLDARPQGGDIVVDIINVGPPIPADLREGLYEPFVQGDSSDTRKAEGLGLGLHVARRLVEAHGGRVELLDGNGLVIFRVRLKPAGAPARPAAVAGAS